MKINGIILLVLLLSVGLMSANAQNKRGEGRRGFNIEQAKEKQAEFFIKELNLTDAEAKAFIPLLNEFTDKKFELNRAVRMQSSALRKQEKKTDADYQKVIDAFLDSKIKEAQLQKEYYQKFQKVLSSEKLYYFQRAEMKFMQRVLENRQGRQGTPNK